MMDYLDFLIEVLTGPDAKKDKALAVEPGITSNPGARGEDAPLAVLV